MQFETDAPNATKFRMFCVNFLVSNFRNKICERFANLRISLFDSNIYKNWHWIWKKIEWTSFEMANSKKSFCTSTPLKWNLFEPTSLECFLSSIYPKIFLFFLLIAEKIQNHKNISGECSFTSVSLLFQCRPIDLLTLSLEFAIHYAALLMSLCSICECRT